MGKKPTGFGLAGACLALAVAASVPVGGCRGESPVRVVRSESSGVGISEDATSIKVPEELKKPHAWQFGDRLAGPLERVVNSLEAPIEPNANRFGLSRASVPLSLGNHTVGSTRSELLLFGNGTGLLSADSWHAKVLTLSGVTILDSNRESRKLLEPLAKEAATYYQSDYRGSLYWKKEIGLMEARPVVLNEKTCLNCHKDNKVGDVAGIVIARLNPDEVKQIEEWHATRNAKRNP